MARRFVTLADAAGGLTLSYLAHGDPEAGRTIVCVHGLTRNAHDFDDLAAGLIARSAAPLRILSFDVAGRGGSDWLADPNDYQIPTYVGHLCAALAQLGLDRVDWIGTSMGGLIGMAIAAAPDNPLERLVLNDIGPFAPAAALAPIGAYLGLDLAFRDLDEVEAHFRAIHEGFGALDDDAWRRMARNGARLADGVYRLHYDPAIRTPFAGAIAQDIDLWPLWDRIALPVMALRGAESALLTAETARAMTVRGPEARLETVAGAGHAPALASTAEIDWIADFLKLNVIN